MCKCVSVMGVCGCVSCECGVFKCGMCVVCVFVCLVYVVCVCMSLSVVHVGDRSITISLSFYFSVLIH